MFRQGGTAITAFVIIFQHVVAVASMILAFYALSLWQQKRMMFFAMFSVIIALMSVGYLFEVTAPDLGAAVVAVKVTYLGAPFLGSLYYLFARDYVGAPRLATWKVALLFSVPAVCCVSVLFYPYTHLYYAGLDYLTTGWQAHLGVHPGILYYPCFIFAFAFTILGTIVILRGFLVERQRRASAVFIIACLLPILAQTAKIVGVVPGEWNPVPTALTLTVLMLCWYLVRFRQRRWQSTGRELIVQNMRDAFILVDASNRLLDFNGMAQRYFPVLAKARVGLPLTDLEGFPAELFEKEGLYDFELEVDNRKLYLNVSTSPLTSGSEREGTSLIIFDNTESHFMMQELQKLARRDGLTGLFNREAFFREAGRSFDLNMRQPDLPGTAMMMDIDFFKAINDTWGHAVGDEVLAFIGRILNRRFRHTDICGRYGGEEFCAWLPHTDIEGARLVAADIRQQLSSKVFKGEGFSFSVTISIGIASIRDSQPEDFADLIKKADEALYAAKENGRDQVQVYGDVP
ncbi:MAG: diguanylate cyclase [Coriobacteriales bacterium]|jgi:diguanylate cyclase (GGDEF)-like protein|nr:diguanylate cyclase [Coriobacteriales bacterium]